MPDLYAARLSLIFDMTMSFCYIDNRNKQTKTLKSMDIMLLQRLMLDRTPARSCMAKNASNHKGEPSWFHQRQCNHSNRAKKKFIQATGDRRKKKGGRNMFSSYDKKRPTQAGKHRDLPLHMCEVWGKQAVLGLLGMCGKETEWGYMWQGKMIVESETLGWEVSLKQEQVTVSNPAWGVKEQGWN